MFGLTNEQLQAMADAAPKGIPFGQVFVIGLDECKAIDAALPGDFHQLGWIDKDTQTPLFAAGMIDRFRASGIDIDQIIFDVTGLNTETWIGYLVEWEPPES